MMTENDEKLVKILKYVSEHNEFYKNRIKKFSIKNPLDITQWPILTRDELQANRYNMFSDGYRDKYFNQQLHRQFSSGSSGMPVNVYWDKNDWCKSNLYLWRKRFDSHSIRSSDKYVVFTLNAFDIQYKKNTPLFINQSPNVIIINFSLVHNIEDEINIVKIINEFNPTWLYIQPSLLDKLIFIYKTQNIKKPSNLRYIEFVGEILTNDVRRRAQDFFGIEISNLYGSEEFNGIAYESKENNFEILKDNVYVEVLKKNNIYDTGVGEAIITSLTNYAMPLIRYNLQDIISLQEITNGEQQYKYINSIAGRKSKIIEIDDIQINTFMLAEIISEVNNELYDPIKKFKYVYSNNNHQLDCFVQIFEYFDKWDDVIISYIINKFDSKINSNNLIKFNVKIVAVLPNDYGKQSILEIK